MMQEPAPAVQPAVAWSMAKQVGGMTYAFTGSACGSILLIVMPVNP